MNKSIKLFLIVVVIFFSSKIYSQPCSFSPNQDFNSIFRVLKIELKKKGFVTVDENLRLEKYSAWLELVFQLKPSTKTIKINWRLNKNCKKKNQISSIINQTHKSFLSHNLALNLIEKLPLVYGTSSPNLFSFNLTWEKLFLFSIFIILLVIQSYLPKKYFFLLQIFLLFLAACYLAYPLIFNDVFSAASLYRMKIIKGNIFSDLGHPFLFYLPLKIVSYISEKPTILRIITFLWYLGTLFLVWKFFDNNKKNLLGFSAAVLFLSFLPTHNAISEISSWSQGSFFFMLALYLLKKHRSHEAVGIKLSTSYAKVLFIVCTVAIFSSYMNIILVFCILLFVKLKKKYFIPLYFFLILLASLLIYSYEAKNIDMARDTSQLISNIFSFYFFSANIFFTLSIILAAFWGFFTKEMYLKIISFSILIVTTGIIFSYSFLGIGKAYYLALLQPAIVILIISMITNFRLVHIKNLSVLRQQQLGNILFLILTTFIVVVPTSNKPFKHLTSSLENFHTAAKIVIKNKAKVYSNDFHFFYYLKRESQKISVRSVNHQLLNKNDCFKIKWQNMGKFYWFENLYENNIKRCSKLAQKICTIILEKDNLNLYNCN